MRLDKFLCDNNIGTRSQVKEYIKKGQVAINGQMVKKPETKVNEDTDIVICQGKEIHYQKYVYYMLNKPEGVVSATNDNTAPTVVSLLAVPEQKELFPVGRLDKDTEGLLLLTNDGELAHALLSPKKHVEKEYECHLAHALTAQQIERLEQGVDIGEKELTRPSRVRVLTNEVISQSAGKNGAEDGSIITLTITEGKFHQVKRMLHAVDNEVLYLKRIRMGNLVLDERLEKGAYRRLEKWEITGLV